MEPCPADSKKRSRFNHLGDEGSKFSPEEKSDAPTSAEPKGKPKCPELHACTASIANPLA